MSVDTQTTNASLSAHTHDLYDHARRISRLEYVLFALVLLEGAQLALHIILVGIEPILRLIGV